MEKRGQGAVSVIVGIIVIIGLLGIIAWSFTPGITGQVVSDNSEIELNAVNYLAEPFQLRGWVINENGVKLNVKNIGGETFIVKGVEVEGCGRNENELELRNGNSEIFEIDCNLGKGQNFVGAIVLGYSTESEVVVKKVYGNIDDIV